jgi:hypothetical protein
MRFLCVCNSGHVRSVTLNRLLHKRGFQSLACGVDKNFTDETLLMLFNWADKIFYQKDAFKKLESRIRVTKMASEFFGAGYGTKADFRYDVGPDDWKVPQHVELLGKLRFLVDAFPADGDKVPALDYQKFMEEFHG